MQHLIRSFFGQFFKIPYTLSKMITFSVKGLRKNCEVPSCVTITYFSGGSKLEYKILLIALFMKFCYDFGVHF